MTSYDEETTPLSITDARPFCSILNTVVDYAMHPPSPLEPEEYNDPNNNKDLMRVPVLRIFGPIVRRDNDHTHLEPHQSACLQIHGAFPYMLARPRIAGPDGGLVDMASSTQFHLNWDDVESVERAVPVIKDALEDAIQNSMADFGKINNGPITDPPPVTLTRVIRKVSVVVGRGFYTYCPGPPAPFLKIEYYDPQHRWRVKRQLEKGLELAPLYHPDPRQYDHTLKQRHSQESSELSVPETLMFHCYEAHIPPTMQFFKDYNLAGMAYIHVRHPFFRHPLPTKRRVKYPNHEQEDVDEALLFLRDNVPTENTWEARFPDSKMTKESTCDVELDITVQDILNVHDILTEVLDDERDDVHWRAVPSLREVWREERRRMRRLLAPEHNFLASQFDDSGKKESSSGTRLACAGMGKLLSQRQKSSFSRALCDIAQRYEESIEEVNQRLLKGRKATNIKFTPSSQDAEFALGALGGMFEGDADEDQGKTFDHGLTQQDRLQNNDVPSTLTPKDAAACFDDFEFSQRVDRGESIHGKDIDPDTLCQAEDSDEEEEQDIQDIERELTVLATQALEYDDDHGSLRKRLQGQEPDDDSPTQEHDDEIDSDTESLILLQSSFSAENGSQPTLQNFENDENVSSNVYSPRTRSRNFPSWQHPANSIAFQTELPPRRRELAHVDSRLHPLAPGAGLPKFLEQMATYETMYRREGTASTASYKAMCSVAPVTLPPSCRAVSHWCSKMESKDTKTERKRKRHDEDTVRLEVDSNSRKIVCMERNRASDRKVEEVEWQSSQIDLSLTQKVQSQVPSSEDDPILTNNDHNTPLTYGSDIIQSTGSETQALDGIGNQGGRIHVAKGGNLKAKLNPTQMSTKGTDAKDPHMSRPITMMSIEVHIQCRNGRAGVKDSRTIALTPDSSRDPIHAVTYAFAIDPGGGESIRVVEYGCICVPVENEMSADEENGSSSLLSSFARNLDRSMPKHIMGFDAPFKSQFVRNEWLLLERLASTVYLKDPDMIFSWDTQASGLGYIVERGLSVVGKVDEQTGPKKKPLDMARLLSRTRRSKAEDTSESLDTVEEEGDRFSSHKARWRGSGLGNDWDEKVGAGAAAASIAGRLVFAAWKIVAEEVKHANVSYLPAVVSSVLGRRIPHHDNQKLTEWYATQKGRERWRVIHHRLVQASSTILLFDALDVIGRSGEAARLSGVEFSQSFPGIRGSQYKVEGVLLRALKSLNSNERGSRKGFIAGTQAGATMLSDNSKSQTQSPWKALRLKEGKVTHTAGGGPEPDRSYYFFSPSLDDANSQEALEVQALTLEPESGHEVDPVIVCDFTALYPSLIIAYNLCFSTCAGRLEYHSTRDEMRRAGRTTGRVGPFQYAEARSALVIQQHIKSLFGDEERRDRAYVTPTGSIFVAESVVKGVLPQVLDEILTTRAMLKKASKQYKKFAADVSPAILRQLEARQLALKYVANVTYGYTSATFSGRCAMPLLADTIVECARQTLTRAIELANSWGLDPSSRWYGCKVVYGDTDSCFVRLPGRSVQEAFTFGEEFCKAVTLNNPPPVQLKLEKVYMGSLLQTKKKYCGMKFESRDQKKPVFEAKGLEIVRRDQCSLTQKVLRNALISLFKGGPNAVRPYLERQWSLILAGQLPVSDFILTGRVRSSYRGGRIGPVQAVLARRLAEADPGRVVRHKERLAYVIVATPGVTFRLRDCVLTPLELLEQWDAYTIHANYYITKHVNASLQRCFGLAPHHLDISAWYAEAPKPRRRIHFWPVTRSGSSSMIHSYFGSDICSLCGRRCKAQGRSKATACEECRRDPADALIKAEARLSHTQTQALKVARECRSCNKCVEVGGTFAQLMPDGNEGTGRVAAARTRTSTLETPLANCTCIDCPITYERHSLREQELESEELISSLKGTSRF